MINVTKTFFPPIEEYDQQIDRIWKNQWLTNRGALVLELEANLKAHLEMPDIIVMNNGTIPIQIALKLLAKNGEVITTPFSYVATSAAILWENATPVFVDIHPDYLTIDETKIESSITDKTTCILATHVFGNPCNVLEIEKIAKKHGLAVIYDAAHCFDVKYLGKSIFSYGDVSTCSFHATKLFHTGEGGAAFFNDVELGAKLFYSHNFGHNGPQAFHGLGINGKISELQAAMGLAVLPHINAIKHARRQIVSYYDLNLTKLQKIKIRDNTEWNYSYFPIIFENEELLLEVQKALNSKEIFPRRYFYPSLNTLNFINGPKMPISESISERILCLPLSHEIDETDLNKICTTINELL
jgi:dTDP-4-amino-4,6-dideoxygalactose transaminase